jgi:hypothetical protein
MLRLSANGMKGMNCFNAGKSLEVLCVESQDAQHTMDMHGRNEAGVVDLDSGDSIIDQELPPFPMDCSAVNE